MMPFWVPEISESLHFFGEPANELIPERIRLLVWNVYKGKKGDQWRRDFLQLSQNHDLILMQEAVMDHSMPKIWKENLIQHQWKMASSFIYQKTGVRTGVATGSKFSSKKTEVLRGSEREVFIWTPKVSLSSLYEDPTRRTLLVINTHVVNFTTTQSFVNFIQEIVDKISHHQGPLLLAGDFNTWNFKRWLSLLEILERLGLEHVAFPKDPRFIKLDHVFVRDIVIREARVRKDIKGSDHSPLELVLELAQAAKG